MNPLLSVCVLLCSSCLLFSDSVLARYAPLYSPAAGPALAPLMWPVPRPSSGTVAPSSSGVAVTTEKHGRHLDTELILAIILASVALVAIILGLFGIWFYRRNNHLRPDSNGAQNSDGAKVSTFGPILGKFNSMKTVKKGSVCAIDHALLEAATNNFSESNVLGEGGFGRVYKACMDDGVLVAVKKMENGGEDFEREFENEMDLLCRIRHPNIVSLLGYSNDGQTRFLVYELMQNGSLESQLHGPSNGSALTWHIRMKIALDAARGLEYLHEHCNPPVIHRDLKSSNILLDSEFNAKISDFGLAVTGQSKGSVKLSGTLGYVAPEYLLDGKLTEKSDVYAFGVVLLELLMGRKPVEKITPSQCQSIVTWAMPQLTDRSKLPNIVDPVIRNTMDLKHLYQVAAVAVLCIQPEPSYRPLITDVLHSLIPLVPIELGGALRILDTSPSSKNKLSSH
ncbi:unnamed protein product [Spirodela intermedia]|uniref:Protein kinase domain-containing protein n=1 Tax=Spirodela intermedia TaxID=51605 RepID=A0A7I8LFQ5_SPIIN|nr:unnamed protein product [Spirodela intermedia]